MKFFGPRLAEDVPLLTQERLAWIVNAEFSDKDVQAAEHPMLKRIRADMTPQMQIMGDVAVIPVEGTLAYNPDPWEMLYYGVEDSRSVLKMFNDAAGNPDVRGALVRMDTPGGMMLGGPEIGDAVAAMAKAGKPVVTHIGGLGASLGYLIASQSTEIVASRSSMVGSIGVISSVTDYTAYLEKMGIKMEYFTNKEAKFKAAGAVGTSLSDEQRSYIQARVDSAFAVFKEMVSSKRPQVKTETMQGQMFRGEEARALGLVDAVGSEQAAMATLRRHIEKRQNKSSIASQQAVQDRGADVLARYVPGNCAEAKAALHSGKLSAKQIHAQFEIQRLEPQLANKKGSTRAALEKRIAALREVFD